MGGDEGLAQLQLRFLIFELGHIQPRKYEEESVVLGSHVHDWEENLGIWICEEMLNMVSQWREVHFLRQKGKKDGVGW
jgi:hypothetical protein